MCFHAVFIASAGDFLVLRGAVGGVKIGTMDTSRGLGFRVSMV